MQDKQTESLGDSGQKEKKPTVSTGGPRTSRPAKKDKLIFLLVILAVVVGVIAFLYEPGSNNSRLKITTAKEYKEVLSKLAQEHADDLEVAVSKVIENPKAAVDKEDLYVNSKGVSTYVAGIYGTKARDDFNKAWNSYIDETMAYSKATAEKNESGQKAAEAKVTDKFVVPATSLLVSKNKKLDQTTLSSMFGAYAYSVRDVISAKVNKAELEKAGAKPVTNFESTGNNLNQAFQYIADKIVEQYPQKFKNN